MIWIIKRIAEADFGCEERMPGEPLMAVVTLESEELDILQFEVPEEWLLMQGLDLGDEWPEEIEEKDEISERAMLQAEIMQKYLDSLEEEL